MQGRTKNIPGKNSAVELSDDVIWHHIYHSASKCNQKTTNRSQAIMIICTKTIEVFPVNFCSRYLENEYHSKFQF